MKRTAISVLSLFLTAAGIVLAGVAVASTRGDSAHGDGELTTGGSAVTTFVFSARVRSDATVEGKARFYDGGALSLDIDVDCLTVSGNTAIIGGTDVASPSTTYAFKVTDNGGGATADRITLPQNGQTCATFNTLGNHALTAGDIEVHDRP